MSSAGGAEGALSNSPSVLSLARAEDRREAPPKKAALLAADADDGADEGPSEESLLYIATRFHGVPSEAVKTKRGVYNVARHSSQRQAQLEEHRKCLFQC
ncbi:hypothetical protein HPB48_024589 [Haemaphysalis longicornis]|uniref:Uncharacterized protein n=1 Tax=Haemaphysalis longicornis TaxID=44386 RepID=A0A9J6H8F9_HAELO|nr:hypothetical protein HPB48_024589 [Haemaphysalis longicornis]